MSRIAQVSGVLALILFPYCPAGFAHGDLHERIETVSLLLENDPTNAELLFDRGSLHEQHGDFLAAVADLNLVEQLAPATEGLYFARARSYFGLEHFAESLADLDRITPTEANEGRVLLWRGRTLSRLQRHDEAATSYRAAFIRIERASPDLYLEFAGLIAAGGEEYFAEAIAGLDHAIGKIGPVITLNLAALELEEKLRNYEAALHRLNQMLEQTPGMATLLKRKGDVLRNLNRVSEATRAYEIALESLESLPASRRNTESNKALEKEIQAKLNE